MSFLIAGAGVGGGGLLLENPVGQGGDSLTPLLLGGILFLGGEVDLLLDTVGGEGALLLEAARGDVFVAGALGTEPDVDALYMGVGIELAGDEVLLGDAVLRGLHLGGEDAEAVDLDGVAL